MPAGRNPRTHEIDNNISKLSKEEIEITKEMTPICETQEFEPPSSLTKEELKIWNDTVKIIRSVQGSYVSDADVMTLEVFCKAKAEYDRACKEWAKNPDMYVQVLTGGKDRDGDLKSTSKINQWYVIKKDFSMIMLKYLDQLGISPLGRAKQGKQATKSKMAKEKEDFMNLFNRSDD